MPASSADHRRVFSTWDWARVVSSSVPRPASSRACTRFQVRLLILQRLVRDLQAQLLAAQLEVVCAPPRPSR